MIDETELTNEMDALNKEIRKLEAEAKKIQDIIRLADSRGMSVEIANQIVNKYRGILNNELSDETKKIIIEKLIDEIVITYDSDTKQFKVSFFGKLNEVVDNDNSDIVLLPHRQEVR